MCEVVFVEEPGKIAIDAKGVTITYQSGDNVFVRRMALADFRAFMADAGAKLCEYDAAQRKRVVEFPKGRRGRH